MYSNITEICDLYITDNTQIQFPRLYVTSSKFCGCSKTGIEENPVIKQNIYIHI